ncbi:MAG: gamma-glutamyltransferase [Rhodopirellula sp.]|jgi:gamma-glutamyltranspeptidase/glutathione hydrolase|nr:gamma-glutamyltransferase [Rhodopirellula sp.]
MSQPTCNRTLLQLITLILFAVTLMTEPVLDAQTQDLSRQAGYDRPVTPFNQSRSVVVAKNGLVATSHPLAAQTGLDILKAGGNAMDAAIAVNAMLGVVEPMSNGIGGDLFCIYWDNKSQKLYGLNASGRSPYKATREYFAQKGLDEIPLFGPLAWSIPGCVSGWQALNERFGSVPLKQILAPSIHTAREGFPVSEVIAHYWKVSTPSLAAESGSAQIYLIDGKYPPGFGEIYRLPKLADSYQLIAEQGADAFYRGKIAQAIVAYSDQVGGLFTMNDFLDHKATWVDPVSTNYRGYDVWELPPSGQGIAALQMLNLIEPYDVKRMGPASPDWLHLFSEAKKLAFEDRAKFYADIDVVDVPVDVLISKAYAKQRGVNIDMQQANQNVGHGDPRIQNGDTVYLTVVDKDRNCCSLIQSIFHGFGSKVTVPEVGFAIQNRGALFSLDENHPNRLEPHKRPFHTIIPAMVTKDNQPHFCFGVMGGDMQPQGHVQILINMIDFGMNVQHAGDLARIRHLGSSTPTGKQGNGLGIVEVESGIPNSVVKELQSRGHEVRRSIGGFGGYQGILIDHKNGVLHGATEPRKDGAAVGY